MQLNIKQKLYLNMASLLIFSITIISINIVSDAIIGQKIKNYNKLQDLINLLDDKYRQQTNWMNELVESIALKEQFNGELNFKKCGFGVWYYGFKNSEEYKALDKKNKDKFDSIETAHADLHRTADRITNRVKNKDEKMELYKTDIKANAKKIQEFIKESIELNKKEIISQKETVSLLEKIKTISLIIVLISIFSMAVFIGISIIKSVSKSFKIFTNVADKVTAGNVNQKIEIPTHDEFKIMSLKFNEFLSKIYDVIRTVKDISFQLATSAEEMSKSTTSFADNAQGQAASAEQVTATAEEIGAGMECVANSTVEQYDGLNLLIHIMGDLTVIVKEMEVQIDEALKKSNVISEAAKTGEKSLQFMNESVKKIGESSNEVRNIIKIINDISEQINLLSLNAAIEAARAGDAGRGFAVVADEISKLADQTAASINDINALIKTNEEEIAKGAKRVNETVSKLQSIIDGVNFIAEMMNKIYDSMERQVQTNDRLNTETDKVKIRTEEIKNAVDEQKIAVSEIVKSISNINDLTQANATGAEQMAGNAEELAGMTETLKEKVDYFKV